MRTKLSVLLGVAAFVFAPAVATAGNERPGSISYGR